MPNLCALLSLLLMVVPSIAFAESSTLRAGAAAVEITPLQFPLNMPGGFSENLASSAHDPLHSRALVIDDGKTTLAMVVVDNLGAPPEVLTEAKQLASRSTGIPPERMLICSTHTHTAPASDVDEGSAEAVGYRRVFVNGVSQSIIAAHAALRPAAFGTAVQSLPDEVFNRRWFLKMGKMPLNPFGELDMVKMNPGTRPDHLDRAAGPVDPDLSILSFQDQNRKPLAMFANYSLHYVGGVPRAQVSADYFGEFARLMPSRLGASDGFVAMMCNGTSGDVNNIPFTVTRPPREAFEQIRIVAQKAADAAWLAHAKIDRHRSDVSIAMVERNVELKYRRPTTEQVAKAQQVLATDDPDAVASLPRLAQHYARKIVQASERKEDTLTVTLQAIRIGDAVVCGIPFETFAEIGLEIKARSPFPYTVVVGLANGRHGYLPTPQQHRLGGYETWIGTNIVQEDASVIQTEQLLQMLGEL